MQKDHLTYFSAKEIERGAIVTVPLRKRLVSGLVVKVEPANLAKTALRNADHSLKKIKEVKCPRLLSPHFLRAAELCSDYFATTIGSVLDSLLPVNLLGECEKLETGAFPDNGPSPFKPEIRVLQDTDEQRLSFYKSLIREEFAKNTSILLCLPTLSDIDEVMSSLGKGIQEYTFVLHNRLAKRELVRTWNDAMNTNHPILAVVTPPFLGLPRSDFKTVIIDREASSAYKSMSRPFTDYRVFAEMLAAQYGAKLIFGDIYVRTETLHRVTNGELVALNSLKQRLISTAENLLLPAKSGETLTPESQQLIAHAILHHERTFILANRRGLSPLVVCDDCGQPTVCERCEAPMVLHNAEGGEKLERQTIFVCHRCNHKQSSHVKCPNCDSWRLRALGSGIEKIIGELEASFPDLTIFQIDSDKVKTPKQAQDIVTRFLAAPGSVLVGTEMALHYLKEKIENALVVSADSLLSLPDFRMHERLFSLLIRTRSLATKYFVIQTRYVEEPLFNNLLAGNLISFYRDELNDRRTFGYPPFRRLVKITIEGERDAAKKEMKKLSEELVAYEPAVYPSFHAIRKGKYRLNLLMKLPAEQWPNKELSERLKTLPPTFAINIDPQDIL
jgi:primosomal protein N' (replication factor Y)